LAALYGEKEVAQLLARLTRQGRLVLQGHAYRLPDHEKSLGGGQSAALEALAAQAALGGLQPERKTALLTACGLDAKTGTALLKLAVREGLLVQIKEDLFYPPQVVDHIIIRLKEYLSRHQKITVIDFKELLAISRKHAVDLLEYFDGQKLTLRLENERVLRQ
ncbi:MAG: SelB C-terminal domain-containing protein, partial [Deltaproteobacteria bacterium]|nr:SelB C-terminal domain-containing protein [Deltaproteobacteria bacterium]